jgi:excisionase family DNA binding protein
VKIGSARNEEMKRLQMSARQNIESNIPAPEADYSTHGALNIPESASYCGVRCSAIESAVRDGKLRGRRLGRNVIILKSDLDDFLAALDIIPAHTPPSVLKRRQKQSKSQVAL